MSHKKTNSPALPFVLLALVVVFIWVLFNSRTSVPSDDSMLLNGSTTDSREVEVPGEKIIPEPQPPQVPLAVVSDAQALPEVPLDIIGSIATLENGPKGAWSIDAVSTGKQGEIVFLSGTLITEGEYVLGGTLVWGFEGLTKEGCIFTIESYSEGHLIGRLQWGKMSKKVDLPTHITFTDHVIILTSTFALPYLSWDVVEQVASQSEFIELKRIVSLATKK